MQPERQTSRILDRRNLLVGMGAAAMMLSLKGSSYGLSPWRNRPIEFYHQSDVALRPYQVGQELEGGAFPPTATVWDDSPLERHGVPGNPKRNPYYFALHGGEFGAGGLIPDDDQAPWGNKPLGKSESAYKGTWARLSTREGSEVFAQWVEILPVEYEKYGDRTVWVSQFVLQSLGDISEALFEFYDSRIVPDGPWKEYPPIDSKVRYQLLNQ